MIAEHEMDLVGMLTFQRRDKVDQLVRLVPAGGIAKRTVDQFLKNEVPLEVFGELSPLHQESEILHVPVEIPRDQYFTRPFQMHYPAAPPESATSGRDGLCQRA
jgi:hypothetical protein